MGEGGASGGASFDGVLKGYDRNGFIQECAIRIIAFSDFDKNSPSALVERAVTTATLLANRLQVT